MFEQALSFVLKKALGEIVEDGNALTEKIQVGVWSGLIVLEDLVLKKSLFSMLDVPIALCYGSIGRFELRIPWSALGKDPVMIIVDKVYLLVEPTYDWNPGAADRRDQAVKQAKLAAADLFASTRLTEQARNSRRQKQSYSEYARNWLLTSLINKIMDNVQVTVRDVHLRYEDKLSCPTNFCVGVTLESLHIQSKGNDDGDDDDDERSYPATSSAAAGDGDASPFSGKRISSSAAMDSASQLAGEVGMDLAGFETFSKLVQVHHLALYWNPLVPSGLNVCCCAFKGRPGTEICAFMGRTIPTRVHSPMDRPRHHYLQFPLDISTFLDVSFNPSTGATKVWAFDSMLYYAAEFCSLFQ